MRWYNIHEVGHKIINDCVESNKGGASWALGMYDDDDSILSSS